MSDIGLIALLVILATFIVAGLLTGLGALFFEISEEKVHK